MGAVSPAVVVRNQSSFFSPSGSYNITLSLPRHVLTA